MHVDDVSVLHTHTSRNVNALHICTYGVYACKERRVFNILMNTIECDDNNENKVKRKRKTE